MEEKQAVPTENKIMTEEAETAGTEGTTGIKEAMATAGTEGTIRTGEAMATAGTEGTTETEEAAATGGAGGNARKKPDRTLTELAVGIAAWGLLCQVTVVWFVADKAGYSLGLWMGVLLAAAAGVHMWWALDRALDYGRDAAVKMITKHNIIRYFVFVIVMALIMVSGFANPLAAFLGLMGLKVAAYLQPFTHKALGFRNN